MTMISRTNQKQIAKHTKPHAARFKQHKTWIQKLAEQRFACKQCRLSSFRPWSMNHIPEVWHRVFYNAVGRGTEFLYHCLNLADRSYFSLQLYTDKCRIALRGLMARYTSLLLAVDRLQSLPGRRLDLLYYLHI